MRYSSRSSILLLLSSCLAINTVLAGLEDAKYSTKLDHANFDAETQKPEVGEYLRSL